MQTLFHIIAPALTLHSFTGKSSVEQYSSIALGSCIPDALRIIFTEYEPTKFDARKFLHYSVEDNKDEFFVQYPKQEDLINVASIKDFNGFSHNVFCQNYINRDKIHNLVDGMTFLENFYKHNSHLQDDIYKRSIRLHLVYDYICVKMFRDYVFTKKGDLFYSNFNNNPLSFECYNKCVEEITNYLQRLYINILSSEFEENYSIKDINYFYKKYLYNSLSSNLSSKIFLNTSRFFDFSKDKWILNFENHEDFKKNLLQLGLFTEDYHFEELCNFCLYIVTDFFSETIKFCEKNT